MQISYSKAWNMLSTLEENLGFHLIDERPRRIGEAANSRRKGKTCWIDTRSFRKWSGNLQMKLLQNASHAMIKTNTVKIS